MQAEEIPSDNIAKEEQPDTASKESSHENCSSNTVNMPAISSAKGGRKLTFVGKDVHIDKPQYNLLGEGKTIPTVFAYHYADLVNSDACIAADGWLRTREGAHLHPYLYVLTALRANLSKLITHIGVTAPLEEVLEVLSSRYDEQLKRRLE